MQRQISSKAKNPVRPSSDSRKVVGEFEPSTLADGEMAVNKKFAAEGGFLPGPFSLDFGAGPAIRRGVTHPLDIHRTPRWGRKPKKLFWISQLSAVDSWGLLARGGRKKLERETGFEPATLSLEG